MKQLTLADFPIDDTHPFTVETQNEEEWKEQAASGIGASEAAAVLGLSKWATPLQVWARKRKLPGSEVHENEAMYWGRVLEEPVCQRYAELTGHHLTDLGRFTRLRSKEHLFMVCTLDRIIIDPTGEHDGPGCLEAKTTDKRNAYLWDEGVPDMYMVQVQHQLAITGFKWGVLAVLIGGNDFRYYVIERDDNLIAGMLPELAEFWKHVEECDEPDVTGAPQESAVLNALHPKEEKGKKIALDPEEFAELDAEYAQLKQTVKEAEARLDVITAQVKQAMGEAERADAPSGAYYSWKQRHVKEQVRPATTYRHFQRYPGKSKKK